jgi:hypothetical protein
VPVGREGDEATFREIARDLTLQLELPRAAETAPWWHVSLPAELFWLIVIVVVAALLIGGFLYLRDEILPLLGTTRRRVRGREGSDAGGAALAACFSEAMVGADELARQGRFIEAMHSLLLEALAELRGRLDEPFADSLTSREILRRAQLTRAAQSALHDIVARVELTHFGRRPADRGDYSACRDSFTALAEAVGAGRA